MSAGELRRRMTRGRRCDRVKREQWGRHRRRRAAAHWAAAHFGLINFRGAFGFSVNRYANVMLERAAGKGAAKPVQ